MDTFPVSYSDLYLYRICGWRGTRIQPVPAADRPLAHIVLYADHASAAMDACDRPAGFARRTVGQRCRPFVLFGVRFLWPTPCGRSILLCGDHDHRVLDSECLCGLPAYPPPKLSCCCFTRGYWFACHPKL